MDFRVWLIFVTSVVGFIHGEGTDYINYVCYINVL